MKATINHTSVIRLIIPAQGFATRLFLEWVALSKFRGLNFYVIMSEREGEPVLIIKMGKSKEAYERARDYINSNL